MFASSHEHGLVYLGHRAFDGLSVAAVLDVAAIFAAEGTGTETLLGPSLTAVRCLEASGAARARWTSADLDEVVRTFGPEFASEPGAILPYAATDGLDRLLSNAPAKRIYGVRHDLKERLDDKVVGKQIFDRLSLPVIEHFVSRAVRSSHDRACDQLGTPYVARELQGSTGSSVYLLRDDADFDRLAPISEDPPVWIFERYVRGYSLNVTGVAFEHDVPIFPPSVQLIGEPSCTDLPFGFCGSDYVAVEAIDPVVVEETARQTREIGAIIADSGFRGLFGVDFLVDGEAKVLPCEVNPRFQNSTALLNFSCTTTPQASPAAVHVESFNSPRCFHNPSRDAPTFSQVIVYAGMSHEHRSVGFLQQGLYQLEPAGPVFVKECFDPNEILEGTFLAVGCVTRTGVQVGAGASIARLIFNTSVLDSGSLRLPNERAAVAMWARHQILGPESAVVP